MDRKHLADLGFALYLLLLVWLVLFKLEPRFWELPQTGRSLNLIPFGASMVRNERADVSEIVYNALAFVPLGMYLSMLNIVKKAWRGIVIGLIVSVAFEALQFAFAIGASDVTDVLMNTLGTGFGFLIGAWLKPKANWVFVLLLILELLALFGYIALLVMQ